MDATLPLSTLRRVSTPPSLTLSRNTTIPYADGFPPLTDPTPVVRSHCGLSLFTRSYALPVVVASMSALVMRSGERVVRLPVVEPVEPVDEAQAPAPIVTTAMAR